MRGGALWVKIVSRGCVFCDAGKTAIAMNVGIQSKGFDIGLRQDSLHLRCSWRLLS